MNCPQRVFFTDLDGTLLDHQTYSWQPAREALAALAARQWPLVINSSKTASEIRSLRSELGNDHPYITENGAVVVIPENYFGPAPEQVLPTGCSRTEVLEQLEILRGKGFRFTGFNDLSVAELSDLTGLDPASAARAADRQATEPLLWLGDKLSLLRFRTALSAVGLQLLEGGRFLHVMGQFDKADGAAMLMARWRALPGGESTRSVALGDSPNDQAMLAGADLAVIIKGVNSGLIQLPPDKPVIRSREPGPAGWNECVLRILKDSNH